MEAATAEATVVERFQLKAFVEAAMLVDEGVASTKDVDLGMMMGAGILPGPLARADEAGLDAMLERLELAEREWGDGFAAPLLLEATRRTRGGWARRPARGSSSTRSPTTASTRRRRSCSRRGASSRSCGSTARRPTRSRRR